MSDKNDTTVDQHRMVRGVFLSLIENDILTLFSYAIISFLSSVLLINGSGAGPAFWAKSSLMWLAFLASIGQVATYSSSTNNWIFKAKHQQVATGYLSGVVTILAAGVVCLGVLSTLEEIDNTPDTPLGPGEVTYISSKRLYWSQAIAGADNWSDNGDDMVTTPGPNIGGSIVMTVWVAAVAVHLLVACYSSFMCTEPQKRVTLFLDHRVLLCSNIFVSLVLPTGVERAFASCDKWPVLSIQPAFLVILACSYDYLILLAIVGVDETEKWGLHPQIPVFSGAVLSVMMHALPFMFTFKSPAMVWSSSLVLFLAGGSSSIFHLLSHLRADGTVVQTEVDTKPSNNNKQEQRPQGRTVLQNVPRGQQVYSSVSPEEPKLYRQPNLQTLHPQDPPPSNSGTIQRMFSISAGKYTKNN